MWSNTKVFILYFLSIILLESVTPGHAINRHYTFVVNNTTHTRLCTTKTMLTVNGMFPGPTITARRGDNVTVNVINHSDHNITIHWHGVKLPRYPWSDGPEYVTQCPIRPGTSFTQLVLLSDEEGTLWWHAHSEWSRATVYGAIIILPPENQPYGFPTLPQAQFPILLGDWWNGQIQEVMDEFLASGGDPNVSDAYLINGQPGDLYPCSRRDTFKVTVELRKTYLFRVINTVMNNIMFFKIANHNITVVGSDGAYTKPLNTDYIAISPGQTIDFLLTANQPPRRYYMAARAYAIAGDYDNTTTTAILEYKPPRPNRHPPHRPPPPPPPPILPTLPPFNDTNASVNFTRQLRSLANSRYPIDVPINVTNKLFFTLSVNLRPCPPDAPCDGPSGERLLASVNNITMITPRTDFLQAYYNNISGVYETGFPRDPPFRFNYTADRVPMDLWRPENGTRVVVLEYNSTVEIVFQGTSMVAAIDHPMHLHGYSFYVVGSGLGNFNNVTDPLNYNVNDPPLMETIAVPANGWTAIRFQANNPGVWFMHCHFERHVSWGMGMVFIVKNGVGPNASMLPPPPMPQC